MLEDCTATTNTDNAATRTSVIHTNTGSAGIIMQVLILLYDNMERGSGCSYPVSKLSKVLTCQTHNYTPENDVLQLQQSGCRPGHGAITAVILTLTHLLRSHIVLQSL